MVVQNKKERDTKRENNENGSKNRNISIVDISAEAKNPPREMFGVWEVNLSEFEKVVNLKVRVRAKWESKQNVFCSTRKKAKKNQNVFRYKTKPRAQVLFGSCFVAWTKLRNFEVADSSTKINSMLRRTYIYKYMYILVSVAFKHHSALPPSYAPRLNEEFIIGHLSNLHTRSTLKNRNKLHNYRWHIFLLEIS